MQLPSPQCCVVFIAECFQVLRSLLLLGGDIETNPGPPNTIDTVLAELKNLSAGQTKLISELQIVKDHLRSTDAEMTDMCKRLNNLETHYSLLSSMRIELDEVKTLTTEITRHYHNLQSRVDDSENHSRRNNLIFYGIPDPNPKESFADSEATVIRCISENLEYDIDPSHIERAHRLGRHSTDRVRPVIVKFNSFKVKQSILLEGKKFKGTCYSVGEDFSPAVRHARRHLVTFAKSKSTAFRLSFKTLFIGSKRYVFDEPSETVKELD